MVKMPAAWGAPFPRFLDIQRKQKFDDSGLLKNTPQASHTDTSCKNCQQLPSVEISLAVFLRTRPWHHQQTDKQKLPVGTRCWSSFIFRNGRSKMWEQKTLWHCARKSARHVLKFFTDQLKKARQMRFSTVGYMSSTQTRVIFDPAV